MKVSKATAPRANDNYKEVCRLSANSRAFFELMPDSLLIISDGCTIERMNAAAVAMFGKVTGQKCYEALFGLASPCAEELCPLRHSDNARQYGELIERKVHDDLFVEYTYVPFQGYDGYQLALVVMRDVTKRKRHELELQGYQCNIEQVLQEKIEVLKESEQLRQKLAREVNILKKEVGHSVFPDTMVGESKALRELRQMIYQVADSDVTVLITGESGTGKELVADLVHQHSNRVGKPFLKFNCAAVAESLLESDLFGYEKGAFTGATACRKGKFEIADQGTIFLDEIGDISPRMQAALLRVLQNGEVVRVGGTQPVKVDVRVLAATNVDLVQAVESGRFRRDLFYRLNVITLKQAPLRERLQDIVPLATHFLKKYREAFRKNVDFLPDTFIEPLLKYDWPGNIRELENVIQRAVLHCQGNILSPADLHFGLNGLTVPQQVGSGRSVPEDLVVVDRPLKESVAALEQKIIVAALQRCGGKTSEVAQQLEVGKTALYEKLKRYGVDPKNFR